MTPNKITRPTAMVTDALSFLELADKLHWWQGAYKKVWRNKAKEFLVFAEAELLARDAKL